MVYVKWFVVMAVAVFYAASSPWGFSVVFNTAMSIAWGLLCIVGTSLSFTCGITYWYDNHEQDNQDCAYVSIGMSTCLYLLASLAFMDGMNESVLFLGKAAIIINATLIVANLFLLTAEECVNAFGKKKT